MRLSFTVSVVPLPPRAVDAAPPAEGAPPPVVAVATVTVRVETRSSRKPLDYVDVTLGAGAPPLYAGGKPAASAAPVRLVTAVKAKVKGTDTSATGSFEVGLVDANGGALSVPLTFAYRVTGAAAPASLEAQLRLGAAAQLVPHVITADEFRTAMQTEGESFAHADGEIPLASAGGSVPTALASVMAVLRSFAVTRSAKHAILHARTAGGARVTALLKSDDGGAPLQIGVKSPLPGHAAAILADVIAAITEAAAEAGKKKGGDDE